MSFDADWERVVKIAHKIENQPPHFPMGVHTGVEAVYVTTEEKRYVIAALRYLYSCRYDSVGANHVLNVVIAFTE